ncbi:hypothetical protein LEMLEM_LOCUS25971 [Lemmus lemmus]
MPSPVSRSGS